MQKKREETQLDTIFAINYYIYRKFLTWGGFVIKTNIKEEHKKRRKQNYNSTKKSIIVTKS